MAKDMPRDTFDAALRSALDDQAAARKKRSPWTPEIDAELWRANQLLRLGSRPIADALQSAHGWGTRNMVEARLALLRKHGGPSGVPR